VQVGAALMLDFAEAYNFGVVVENFGGKEVGLTREQQANNEGS
jgi:hypothetical protein